MTKNDFSREIFDKYFETGRILRITLKDKSILLGILMGVFHGDNKNDPYIVKWHFIHEGQIKEYERSIAMNETGPDMLIILQGDIEKVEFK